MLEHGQSDKCVDIEICIDNTYRFIYAICIRGKVTKADSQTCYSCLCLFLNRKLQT